MAKSNGIQGGLRLVRQRWPADLESFYISVYSPNDMVVVVHASGLGIKRMASGLTTRQLAFLVGATPTQLATIESGVCHVGAEPRIKLLRALDASFEELFTVSVIGRT